jgi:hypothetical protein
LKKYPGKEFESPLVTEEGRGGCEVVPRMAVLVKPFVITVKKAL